MSTKRAKRRLVGTGDIFPPNSIKGKSAVETLKKLTSSPESWLIINNGVIKGNLLVH